MSDDSDRAYRALTDVIDVESVAPGMMRVTSWGGSYVVDARDGGCRCPDKEYNAPLRCKHEIAAFMADTGMPCPWTPDEQTTDQRIMTDGGVAVDVDADEVDGWLVAGDNGSRQVEDSRADAEARVDKAADLGIDAEVYPPGDHPELSDDEAEAVSDAAAFDPSDYDDASMAMKAAPTQDDAEAAMRHFNPDDESDDNETPEVVDHAPDADDAPDTDHAPEVMSADEVAEAADQLPERHVDEDPLKWLPGEFVDSIDGSPAINRKGFEVLGHFYDVSVSADLQSAPEDNDHEYCRVKATATMGDRSVEAFGSAHVDRGDDAHLLLEMADTRARKRALSIATGAGAVAVDELISEPEGGA